MTVCVALLLVVLVHCASTANGAVAVALPPSPPHDLPVEPLPFQWPLCSPCFDSCLGQTCTYIPQAFCSTKPCTCEQQWFFPVLFGSSTHNLDVTKSCSTSYWSQPVPIPRVQLVPTMNAPEETEEASPSSSLSAEINSAVPHPHCPPNPANNCNMRPCNGLCDIDPVTGQPFCWPSCYVNNGGCDEGQVCILQTVYCFRAPCPPSVQCLTK